MTYRYSMEVWHAGLNRYRVVKGQSRGEVQAKANALRNQWDEQWARKSVIEERRALQEDIRARKAQTARDHEINGDEANKLSAEAERTQQRLSSILMESFTIRAATWESFEDHSTFSDPSPTMPKEPRYITLPKRSDRKYNPELSLTQKLIKSKKQQIISNNDQWFAADLRNAEKQNANLAEAYSAEFTKYQRDRDSWQKRKEEFYSLQSAFNGEIATRKLAFSQGNPDAIAFYYDEMLTAIKDPYDFERQIEANYETKTKTLLLDMFFPVLEDLPNLKKVTYTKSTGEFKEQYQTAAYMNQKYDDVVYQTVLQTLYFVFREDEPHGFIDRIVLNGRVDTIDRSTGKQIQPYILSVSVNKDDFSHLSLEQIDAKAWFRSSKGVSAARISNITPVAPIMMLDKEDSRFVEGYQVMNDVDSGINLASMDWLDFENLIRELFHEEFCVNGGEVKITQASRDGGVDAVAFDPSPIRGGKIVIQAKRYTNVVGVSAVRDLYGTVINEGAMKGILITTSYYGNDAYKFAQGKPLSLLNGANLLAMLEAHGHKAHIDLNEAKETLRNGVQ